MCRARSTTLEEQLFAFALLGDDRAIERVYVMGEVAATAAASAAGEAANTPAAAS